MLAYFAVTLGTSDVQFEQSLIDSAGYKLSFRKIKGRDSITLRPQRGRKFKINLKKNRDRKGWFLLASPRNDGEIVLRHINDLSRIISLPLTLPVIESILSSGVAISRFLLIFTDQHDASEYHRSGDTLNIAAIFREQVKLIYPGARDEDFVDFSLTNKVTDIDYQYVGFSHACSTILQSPPEEVEKIILLAQGGIDQVNQALTLQLIQAFGDKLQIYQLAEDSEPRKLNFTHLFLYDLHKQQVIALTKTAHYHGALMVARMTADERFKSVVPFLEFARLRKLFLYKEAEKIVKKLGGGLPLFMDEYCGRKNLPEKLLGEFGNKEPVFLISERFYLADYHFQQENYTEFVLSFQIFYETLAGQYLSDVVGIDITKKHYESAMQLLEHINKNDAALIASARQRLKQKEDDVLMVSFPILAAIAIEVAENKAHVEVRAILEPLLHINSQLNGYSGSCGLDRLRNIIAHEGKGIGKDDLFLASNIKYKRDKLKYWSEMMRELREKIEVQINPYKTMSDFIVDELNTSRR